jgi:hypothetical protein
MATRPQPSQPRPTSGSYSPPSGANPPAPHAAYDSMFGTPPEVTSATGDEWENLPDH